MLSTIVVVVLYLGLLIVSAVLWAVFLRLGLRWAKVPDPRTRQIVLATGIVFLLNLLLVSVIRIPAGSSQALPVLLGLVELAASVFIASVVIMRVFKTRFLRSLQAWLPTLVSSIGMVAFASMVFVPFVYEAFVSPANAMSPTLRGDHWRDECPECGESNFCSPVQHQFALQEPPNMICANFHVHQIEDVNQQFFSADRFLVAKYLTPRRWDLVVFRLPRDSSTLYVMRLVGLPGETIRIEGGAVWANDEKLTPPESLNGIEYVSELSSNPFAPSLWGSPDRPAVLGDDEYFVLGDFSAQSNDSRLWEEGAPGHNPFAVPESHLEGVVTHIYWPPQRLQILR